MKYPVQYWTAYGLKPVAEFRFCPTRRWRFDFAFIDEKIGIEINGGIWTQGRHTRGLGYQKDMEKMNAAAKMHWRVFQFTPTELRKGIAQSYMLDVLR